MPTRRNRNRKTPSRLHTLNHCRSSSRRVAAAAAAVPGLGAAEARVDHFCELFLVLQQFFLTILIYIFYILDLFFVLPRRFPAGCPGPGRGPPRHYCHLRWGQLERALAGEAVAESWRVPWSSGRIPWIVISPNNKHKMRKLHKFRI